VHIWICAGGSNAAGRPKDKYDVELFFPLALDCQKKILQGYSEKEDF
jgi:hypothetical protein